MRRKAAFFDPKRKANLTSDTKTRLDRTIEHVRNLVNDPKKSDRLAQQQCVYCYYGCFMAGAAITSQDCAACGEEQTYGSTATDDMCQPCAEKHGVCKTCMANVNLHVEF